MIENIKMLKRYLKPGTVLTLAYHHRFPEFCGKRTFQRITKDGDIEFRLDDNRVSYLPIRDDKLYQFTEAGFNCLDMFGNVCMTYIYGE